MVATKGMVGFVALIAAAFAITDEAATHLIQASPAAPDQHLFRTGGKADESNELRQNELRQLARAALQTLIEKQAADKKYQITTSAERNQLDERLTGPTCLQPACSLLAIK